MEPSQQKGPWVLIIEDEEQIVKLTTDRLLREGFRVLTADGPGSALKLLRNQKFSCLVVDLRLNGGTGEKLIQQIRADRKGLNADAGIIVVSAFLEKPVIKMIGRDIQKAFVKPADPDELVKAVRFLCSSPETLLDALASASDDEDAA